MKRLTVPALIAIFVFCSCGGKKDPTPPAPAPATETEAAAITLKVSDLATNKDLVCGMTVDEGGIADTASHEGKIYGFCATECKQAFVANPSEYLAKQ